MSLPWIFLFKKGENQKWPYFTEVKPLNNFIDKIKTINIKLPRDYAPLISYIYLE